MTHNTTITEGQFHGLCRLASQADESEASISVSWSAVVYSSTLDLGTIGDIDPSHIINLILVINRTGAVYTAFKEALGEDESQWEALIKGAVDDLSDAEVVVELY